MGPVWRGGSQGEARDLASAYRNALALAREAGAASVAFPAISTGIYGYPLDEATAVAVATVRKEVERWGEPEEVVFACFGGEVLEAYRACGVEVVA